MQRQAVLSRYATLDCLGLPQNCGRPGKSKVIFPMFRAAAAALDELTGRAHTRQERAGLIHRCGAHFHLTRGERKPVERRTAARPTS